MSRLETLPVSFASAEQRRGRAGRLAPGVCYRLYTAAAERQLAPAAAPEILEADLAALALDLACWGTEAAALAWLDPPPPAHLAQAHTLLALLGAVDAHGRATAAGRRMASLGLHPRLAHMLLEAERLGAVGLGCEIAALLADRDVARTRAGERDADLGKRLEILRGGSVAGLEADRGAIERARRLAAVWRRRLAADGDRATVAAQAPEPGVLLAHAYPDRIGMRRGSDGRFLLSGGRGAVFAGPDALARAEFIVVAALDGAERDARIQLAAAISRAALVANFAAGFSTEERVAWDRRTAAVVAQREVRLGALLIEEAPLARAAPERQLAAMLAGIRALGLDALPWTPAARALQARVAFVRALAGSKDANAWPDFGETALSASLEDWLAPFLEGVARREHLARLDLAAILRARLDPRARRALDRLAPTQLTVPSGRTLPIDYAGDTPSVAVRLQEMFGLSVTPTVGDGQVRLAIELLSPAGRPVQVTRDLESFWARGYAEVRRELKGRYPKHAWPEDPHAARPTARARPRR